MRIACKSLYSDFDQRIKIEYLFYDRLLFDEQEVELVYAGRDLKAKLDTLQKQNIIFPEPPKKKSAAKVMFEQNPEFLQQLPKVEDVGDVEDLGNWGKKEWNSYWMAWQKRTDILTRMNSAVHTIGDPDNMYTPITSDGAFVSRKPNEIVLDVVLKKLPVPSATTSWEQLKEIKSDNQISAKLNSLRVWMTDLKEKNFNRTEIEERLTHSLNEYRTALNFHRIEHQLAYINMPIVMALETVENIVKVKWSKVFENIAKLSKAELEILKAESKLPGKEVAFFATLKEQFSN